MLWLQSLREHLRLSLWFVPAVLAVAAAVLALLLGFVDASLAANGSQLFFTFGGSPEGARSVLSTIAQSMLTFTGLVFTITMLVLQLASTQLSPRVMRTFLRDRGNQVVLGIFVATFVFTLLVLRDVRTPIDGGEPFVPAISVWVAFALLLASVAAFVWYIDHMAHAIRASTVIENIWKETAEAIERLYPDPVGKQADDPGRVPAAPPDLLLKSPGAGVVLGVDEGALLDLADSEGRVLELLPRVGDFVPDGAPLVRAWGSWTREAADGVRDGIAIGSERTLEQDAAFGFRQLVDIAARALSPGTNDPTTAVLALDRIHDLLRRLANRAIPSPVRRRDGRVLLVLPRPSWDDFVRLGLEEIRVAGATQVQVVRRLDALLRDLAAAAPADRQRALGLQRTEVDRLLAGHGPASGDGQVMDRGADAPMRSVGAGR
jgi:uncharacterized membrane protein